MNEELQRMGYVLLRGSFDEIEIDRMRREVESILASNAADAAILKGRASPAYGARNLLQYWPDCVKLLDSNLLRNALREILGADGGAVRALFFDKPPGHSWALPWHRDYTIAVREHRPSSLFLKPTVKAGTPHVEAPNSLLQTMITVRIHLDDMSEANGALRVVPGSHLQPDSSPAESVIIECQAGDVLLMRPLLLHASGHSETGTTRHRRIVHLECAPSPMLPDGLEWHDFIPIG